MSIASGCAASTSAACSLRCSIALGPERGMIDRGRRASDFGVGGPANPPGARDPWSAVKVQSHCGPSRQIPSNSVKFQGFLGPRDRPSNLRQSLGGGRAPTPPAWDERYF